MSLAYLDLLLGGLYFCLAYQCPPQHVRRLIPRLIILVRGGYMKTSARLLLWSVVSVLVIITSLITAVGQVAGTRIVTLSVKASFDQGDKKSRYFSYWSGELTCQLLPAKNKSESLEICFPLGLGESPSSLSIHWATTSQSKKTRNSGPVYINLVDSDADPSNVQAWTLFKKVKDPSLKIPLVASTGKEHEYTNDDAVEGKIVAWVTNKKGTLCLPLALMKIPERSMLLRSVPNQTGAISMELTIQLMRLVDFEDDTWSQIIESGNRKLNLPKDPSDAECRSFTARRDTARDEGLHNLTELRNMVLQSYRAGEIGASEILQTVSYLDAYRVSRSDANPSQATANVMRCYRSLNNLVKQGKVKQEDSQTILELNKKLFTHTFPSASSFGRRTPPPSHTASGPEVTYYVRQMAGTYVPDGTSAHPYRSVSEAYDAAKAIDSRHVELVVDGGYYDEALNLDRNTILRAAPGSRPIIASTITCTRALQLEITGFSLMGAPSPGALQVLVPGSIVSIVDVEIREAHRYGIYQRGGEIELRAVTVCETRREAGQMEYGTGVLLQDGVQASLSSVTLNDNESSGLILRGRDSYLSGTEVTLRRNKMHTDFASEAVRNTGLPTGAFLIYDNAVANLTTLRIHESEFVGLGVYGNAEVTVDNAIVNFSRMIRAAGEGGVVGNYGGLGIRARDGGHLTMQNFLVSQCELAGVAVHPLGIIDLHVGDVSFNVIGVHFMGSYDLSRLMDRVRYFDNGTNLDSETLPVPDATPGVPD